MALFAIAATVAASSSDMKWLRRLFGTRHRRRFSRRAVESDRARYRVGQGRGAFDVTNDDDIHGGSRHCTTLRALLIRRARWVWRAPFIAITVCAYLMIIGAIRQILVASAQTTR